MRGPHEAAFSLIHRPSCWYPRGHPRSRTQSRPPRPAQALQRSPTSTTRTAKPAQRTCGTAKPASAATSPADTDPQRQTLPPLVQTESSPVEQRQDSSSGTRNGQSEGAHPQVRAPIAAMLGSRALANPLANDTPPPPTPPSPGQTPGAERDVGISPTRPTSRSVRGNERQGAAIGGSQRHRAANRVGGANTTLNPRHQSGWMPLPHARSAA